MINCIKTDGFINAFSHRFITKKLEEAKYYEDNPVFIKKELIIQDLVNQLNNKAFEVYIWGNDHLRVGCLA